MGNLKNTFKDNPKRASLAGKKSRKPTAELNKLKELTNNKFKETIYRYLDSNLAELKKVMTNTKTKSLDLMVIKLMVKAIKSGDVTRLNFILDRTIGKCVDKLEVSPGVTHKSIIEELEEDD